jgi:hypothetical protein
VSQPEVDSVSIDNFLLAMEPNHQHTKVKIEPENVEQGLVKLVLALVELLRQLLEKQAIRRIEGGTLNDEEIERVGTTLMKLEEKIIELKEYFGIDDLNIDLGPLGKLID